MTDTKPIELRLLGEMEVRAPQNGAADDLAGQTKRLALLAYLALDPGYHRRESLLVLLWPDKDTDSARQALRQSLYHIRKTLGREVFRARGDEVGVDPAALWCDAAALERACDEGDDEAAARLFRGELLPGFHVDDCSPEFEMSLDRARQRLRQKGLRSLRRLAGREVSEGRHDAAIGHARRALELDPHDETALRILIEALGERGDRVEALRAFERFTERYEDEFGFEPSEETRAAMRAVRENVERPPRRATATTLPSTLPRPLTSLVGRERMIDQALQRLERPDVRILTLTGPGGVGKSRLAIEIAHRASAAYPDGIAWANLDIYEDPEAALVTLARAVDADTAEGRCPRATLRERLRGLQALLVLDGLDRIPSVGIALTEILGEAPRVDALLTSRTPIGHSAEFRLPVPPLSLPDRGHHIGLDLSRESEAVALFEERAGAADPEFRVTAENVTAVIDVCRRLDGLPLAIELAAARTRHLPVAELARRLEDDLGLLRDGARDRPDRHGTLDATIRWTSEHLEDDERALLNGLGVFVGDFELSVVETMWPDLSDSPRSALEILSILIDRGLVYSLDEPGGRPRYRLLRTIREHAAEALEASGRGDDWRRRLTEHYVTWTREGFSHWCGPDEAAWLAALDREGPNLDAIVDWAVDAAPARAARIAAAVNHWWWLRGATTDARRRLERILENAGGGLDPTLRARLLVSLGQLASVQADVDEGIERIRRAMEVYERIDDDGGRGWALQTLANVLLSNGRIDEALAVAEEGLAIGERTGNSLRIEYCDRMIAQIAQIRGDLARAETLLDDALARARSAGNRGDEVRTLLSLAQVEIGRDQADLAERYAREALTITEGLGNANDTAYASWVLADALRAGGRADGVHSLYARALELYREIGNDNGVCLVLAALVETTFDGGRDEPVLRIAAGLADLVEARDLRYPRLRTRLDALLDRVRSRVGDHAFDRERAATRGVTLERLLEWAGDLVPTVEIRAAAR